MTAFVLSGTENSFVNRKFGTVRIAEVARLGFTAFTIQRFSAYCRSRQLTKCMRHAYRHASNMTASHVMMAAM